MTRESDEPGPREAPRRARPRPGRMPLVTAAIIAGIAPVYWGLPSGYYTYDSVALLVPDRDMNIYHFGYQLWLRGQVALRRLLGANSSSAYQRLQLVQGGIMAAGFAVFFLSLLHPDRSRAQATWPRILFAAAMTILAALSGGSMRFATILEDYALTALAIIAGLAAWCWPREGGVARAIVANLLWCTAMSFDLTTTLVCAPLVLATMVHLARQRRWRTAACVVLLNASFLATAAGIVLHGRGQYHHPGWGRYGLSFESLRAFGIGAARMLVYLVEPSMPAASTPGWKLLAAGAILGRVSMVLALSIRLLRRPGGIDAIAAVALIGTACRAAFLFWFLPGNSEFLILPFLIVLYLLARGVLRLGLEEAPYLVPASLAAAAVVAVANIVLVGLPAHRQPMPPYLDAVREVAREVHLPAGARLALLCDDECFSVYYRARSAFLPQDDVERYPQVDFLTFAPRAATLTSVPEARSWVARQGEAIARAVSLRDYSIVVSKSEGDRYRDARGMMDSSNHRIAPGLPAYLASLDLPRLVCRRFPVRPGKDVKGFHTWHVLTGRAVSSGDRCQRPPCALR